MTFTVLLFCGRIESDMDTTLYFYTLYLDFISITFKQFEKSTVSPKRKYTILPSQVLKT